MFNKSSKFAEPKNSAFFILFFFKKTTTLSLPAKKLGNQSIYKKASL